MLRFCRKTGRWWLLVATAVYSFIPYAIAQDAAGVVTPNQVQAQPQGQNRAPIPQANHAATLQPQNQSVTAASTPAAHKTAHARQKQVAPAPEAAQAPVIPPTLEQMAPSPPHVSYQNGQLTIEAHNATLSQVLRSVQTQTGASIDVPGGASGERVVVQLGPGRPRDVLASLLNGSHFDYIILGMPGNSGGVQKVILTARQNSNAAVNTAQNNNQSQTVQPAADDDSQDDEPPPPEAETSVPVEVQNPTGPAQFQNPNSVPGQPGQPQDNGDNSQPNGSVRTPEQLLQDLQRMQQQQQQYQQQLNPANQQPQQ